MTVPAVDTELLVVVSAYLIFILYAFVILACTALLYFILECFK